MANSINKVILIGNVGNDPEIRSTQDGKELASFSLATSDSWRDKNTGERKEKTEWHRIVVFSDGLVGVVKNYIKKGSKLYIEGVLQTRKWTDSNNIERYTTEIVLQNFNSTLVMLDNRNNASASDGEGGDGGGYSRNHSSSPASNNSYKEEVFEDKVPF
jgi:single-strand DNA-binding protein